MRDRVQRNARTVRDWVLWSPTRTATAALVAVAVLGLGVVASLTAAALLHRGGSSAQAGEGSAPAEACRVGVQSWADALTARLPDDQWKPPIGAHSSPRAARWIPTMRRDLIPPGPATVNVATTDRAECVAWVTFADGDRWYTSLIPNRKTGLWVVDEWDDQS